MRRSIEKSYDPHTFHVNVDGNMETETEESRYMSPTRIERDEVRNISTPSCHGIASKSPGRNEESAPSDTRPMISGAMPIRARRNGSVSFIWTLPVCIWSLRIDSGASMSLPVLTPRISAVKRWESSWMIVPGNWKRVTSVTATVRDRNTDVNKINDAFVRVRPTKKRAVISTRRTAKIYIRKVLYDKTSLPRSWAFFSKNETTISFESGVIMRGNISRWRTFKSSEPRVSGEMVKSNFFLTPSMSVSSEYCCNRKYRSMKSFGSLRSKRVKSLLTAISSSESIEIPFSRPGGDRCEKGYRENSIFRIGLVAKIKICLS